MKRTILSVIFVVLTLITGSTPLFSFSNAQISDSEYRYALELIRELNIIISNFGLDEEKEDFETIKEHFRKAAERHYARDFVTQVSLDDETEEVSNDSTSVNLFYDLKVELLEMYAKYSEFYAQRAEYILNGLAYETTEIIIEYGKGSAQSKYFFSRAFNPLKDNKSYDADKFHYFKIRATLQELLEDGYRYLQESRDVFKDVDYVYIMSKEERTSRELTFLLEKHRAAIKISRQAKENGIEIYRYLNIHDLGDSLSKYDVNNSSILSYPIYDDRIPESLKIDANDNRNLLWTLEKKRVGNYDDLNPKSAEATTAAQIRNETLDGTKEEDNKSNQTENEEAATNNSTANTQQ